MKHNKMKVCFVLAMVVLQMLFSVSFAFADETKNSDDKANVAVGQESATNKTDNNYAPKPVSRKASVTVVKIIDDNIPEPVKEDKTKATYRDYEPGKPVKKEKDEVTYKSDDDYRPVKKEKAEVYYKLDDNPRPVKKERTSVSYHDWSTPKPVKSSEKKTKENIMTNVSDHSENDDDECEHVSLGPTYGYAVSDKDFAVYSERTDRSEQIGIAFGSSDEIVIHGIYTDGWIKIEYPTSHGTKIGYCEADYLFADGNFADTVCIAGKEIVAYKKADCSVRFGSISESDKCYIVGTDGVNTQVIYPTSSGNKIAWIKGVYSNDNGNLYKEKKESNNYSVSVDQSNIEDCRKRLDEITSGEKKYNANTVMSVGSRFTGTNSDQECKGYARNVFQMCFGINPNQTADNNYELLETAGMTHIDTISCNDSDDIQEMFAEARPGDFVQIRRAKGTPHSAIVYSVSSDGVEFLEANVDRNNGIKIEEYTWEALKKNAKMSLYTATEYKLK